MDLWWAWLTWNILYRCPGWFVVVLVLFPLTQGWGVFTTAGTTGTHYCWAVPVVSSTAIHRWYWYPLLLGCASGIQYCYPLLVSTTARLCLRCWAVRRGCCLRPNSGRSEIWWKLLIRGFRPINCRPVSNFWIKSWWLDGQVVWRELDRGQGDQLKTKLLMTRGEGVRCM